MALRHCQDANNPKEIAKVCYAKGEITKEQFDQMNRDLNNGGTRFFWKIIQEHRHTFVTYSVYDMHVPKESAKKEGYPMHFYGFDRFRGGIDGFDRLGQAGWFGQYAWLMPLMMLVFWIIVISLIVFFVRRSRHHNMAHNPQFENKALSIVKERYAKGEISKEEFDRLASDLKN